MASIRPDPKKRGYLLPPGCKDLADVLQRRNRKTDAITQALRGIVQTRGEPVTSRLSKLEQYVTRVCESEALMCHLSLDSPDQELAVNLYRGKGLAIQASLSAEVGTDRDKAVRQFFVRHDFRLPADSGMPAQFRPELPVHQIYNLSPLPPEAPLVSSVMTALFQEVGGLSDESELCFRYDETTITA